MTEIIPPSPSRHRTIFVILGVSVLFIIIVTLFLFTKRRPNTATAPVVGGTAEDDITRALPAPRDTDRDTLSDAEEQKLGTDQTKGDTDGDGLSDATEVNKTKTDPLRPRSKDPTLTDLEWAQKQQ